MSGNPTIGTGRGVARSGSSTLNSTDSSAALRNRLVSPSYSGNDRAVATEMTNLLDSERLRGSSDGRRNAANMLGAADIARGHNPPRVPSREHLRRISGGMRRLRDGATDAAGASANANVGSSAGGGVTAHESGGANASSTANANASNPTSASEAGASEPAFGVTPSPHGGEKRLRETTFLWDYSDVGSDVAGFRIYHEGELVAESHSGADRQMVVELELEEGAHVFTMTAYDTAGRESPHSAPAVLNYVFEHP